MNRRPDIGSAHIARLACRRDAPRPTAGMAPGFTQCNMISLPRDWAWDFLLYAQRNPKPCPVLDVTDPGSHRSALAPDADLRTDIPLYRVWRDGKLAEETPDATAAWAEHPDLVTFLIGCSFTFETPLQQAGIEMRHIAQGRNVPMFLTDRDCRPAGRLHGKLVVSMRPIPAGRVAEAVTISGRTPAVHGAPVHISAPEGLGIRDLMRPDFGDPVDIRPGEVPVFWACGVTPQAALMASRPPFAITHAPGHMFITDIPDTNWQV
ncbi:putative hydro-lyase [Paracoccus marinaquae]|uniref:Putative hydro-lyase KNW02_11520 n=1 Tax=Paracoccus marinaquae TaxID=2841926 RepID=A0ABS6ALH5_9RHOB|nr:putative hydro-lyase [Paracoccus marinaquae]MBU3030742.1 putative hydro-lyase [Paracoccus marinaquae]